MADADQRCRQVIFSGNYSFPYPPPPKTFKALQVASLIQAQHYCSENGSNIMQKFLFFYEKNQSQQKTWARRKRNISKCCLRHFSLHFINHSEKSSNELSIFSFFLSQPFPLFSSLHVSQHWGWDKDILTTRSGFESRHCFLLWPCWIRGENFLSTLGKTTGLRSAKLGLEPQCLPVTFRILLLQFL